ncbi:MAG: aspartic peptidase domain-containing protein [Benjaminiella poitrasii]|nr:MAG: aspartic peptidase domain-containing protein [Benjaminiella poitrasii]
MKYYYSIEFISLLAISVLGSSTTATTNNPEPLHLSINKLNIASSSLVKRSNSAVNVPLYNDFGQVYLANISVGTPPQNFSVIVDTQSSDLWIPSVECNEKVCPDTTFDSSKSSTFKSLNEPFSYEYNDGTINGTYVKDTVALGGLKVLNQQFVLADRTSKTIIANDYKQRLKYGASVSVNGVLGLGFQSRVLVSNGEAIYKPLLYSMVSQGLIPEMVFSIFTGSVLDEGWAGEMTLGGVNEARYEGDIGYAAVPKISRDGDDNTPPEVSLWLLQTQSLSLLDTAVLYNANTKQNETQLIPKLQLPFQLANAKYALIDTGSSLSYVGGLYAKQLVLSLTDSTSVNLDADSGCYIVDCALANSTQHVKLEFARFTNGTSGTVSVTIPIKQLVQPQHVEKTIAGKDDTCIFSICSWPPSDDSDDVDESNDTTVFVLGDSVLRSMYLVFDAVRDKIGFASPIGTQVKVSTY